MKLPERLKSRKFWVAVLTALGVFLNEALDLGVRQETLQELAIIVSAYLLGQSFVDFGVARANSQKYAAWVAATLSEVGGVRRVEDASEGERT